MIYALIGNPNSGKTTLFNQLTGKSQHVGNFPGVTVEKKMGIIHGNNEEVVIDLPGIYSLLPYSNEEIVTRNFLLKDLPDAIINIVDATNIERNLYLTLQLIELGIPMVIALNMMDEVKRNGGKILVRELSNALGIPIIPISASQNEGIDQLLYHLSKITKEKRVPKAIDIYKENVQEAILSITQHIQPYCKQIGISERFVAIKILEGDSLFHSPSFALNIKKKLEEDLGMDSYSGLSSMRYQFIESVVKETVRMGTRNKERERTRKIDAWLTHPYLGIPFFILMILTIFYLSFGSIGAFLMDCFSQYIDITIQSISHLLLQQGVSPILHSMVIEGALTGIGSVLSFLPIVITLFFFLSLLEDSGYMARIAFMMDKPLSYLGLSGRSFVPLLIGLGCSVPAVMATRTLSSRRNSQMTIFLIPFVSCLAKLPIYSILCYTFFKESAPFVMVVLYLLGIVLGITYALIINGLNNNKEADPFIMELPNYRFPSLKNTLFLVWVKVKEFLIKAFTLIFIASMVIWFLRTFDINMNVVSNAENSLLASFSKILTPIFVPLGLGDWRMITALVTGFSAKEAVMSTLVILTSSSNLTLQQLFSPLTAFSFLVFSLLYSPCCATIAVIARELHSYKRAFMLMITQTGIAFFVAFMVYQLGRIVV